MKTTLIIFAALSLLLSGCDKTPTTDSSASAVTSQPQTQPQSQPESERELRERQSTLSKFGKSERPDPNKYKNRI